MSKQTDPTEMISKSLDEIDSLLAQFSPSGDISKGGNQGNDNLNPDDVSEDAPEPEEDSGEDNDNVEEDTDGDNDPEDGDVDNDQEPEEDQPEEEDTHKSLDGELTGGDSVKKALEVSEFLRDLVTNLGTILDSQRSELTKSLESSSGTQVLLAKSFEGLAKSQRAVLETQAELLKSVRTLNKRVKAMEGQPLVRKSVANAQVVEKSFNASTGGVPSKTTLSKSDAVSKLMAEVRSGKAEFTQDLLALESVGDFNVLSKNARNLLGL